jgi:3-oxoadipate enol-lactonase
VEATVNGARLSYEEYGAGPPVVLVHGLGGTGTDIWKHVIADLAEDFRVVVYDLRGSGTSEATPGPYTIDLLQQDLDLLVSALDLGAVALMGHSLGGGIALAQAARRPESVRAVVGVGAVTTLPDAAREGMRTRAETVESAGMAAVAETVATNGVSPTFREHQPEEFQELISLLGSANPAGYAAQCRALEVMDLTDELSSVRAPALLVAGELDQASPVARNESNAALVGAELVVLPDCAHIISWEKPAELLAAARPVLGQGV